VRNIRPFDPTDCSSWPEGYRDALDPSLGDAGVRLVARLDHRGIDVFDVWDMRPARNGGAPVCKAQGIEEQDHANRAAEDVYAGRKIFVMGGKTWHPRKVQPLTES